MAPDYFKKIAILIFYVRLIFFAFLNIIVMIKIFLRRISMKNRKSFPRDKHKKIENTNYEFGQEFNLDATHGLNDEDKETRDLVKQMLSQVGMKKK